MRSIQLCIAGFQGAWLILSAIDYAKGGGIFNAITIIFAGVGLGLAIGFALDAVKRA